MLQCPRTGQPLDLDLDVDRLREINAQISSGDLALASREAITGQVQALLSNRDGDNCYPVADGMSYLLADNHLTPATGEAVARPASAVETAIQREQMAKYSQVYERWTGGENGITRATQKVLNQRYGKLFQDATVMDIGNGGTPAEVQLGSEIAAVIKRFIAADKSPDMLRRSGAFSDLLLADAFQLPFQDDSVDIVTVNNTIHHFGRRRGDNPQQTIQDFFSEALRVARKGVIGVELLVPTLGQWAETALLNAIGYMPTFVYSADFYRHSLQHIGGTVTDFEVRSLGQLTNPLRIIPPVLDYTWLRVPTFCIPYSFLFFSIEKTPGSLNPTISAASA